MKKTILGIFPLLLITVLFLSSCRAIGEIFKAGAWTGAIGIILIVGLAIFIFSKLSSKNKE